MTDATQTVVDVSPIYKALEPYLVSFLGASLTAIAGWVLRQFQVWIGADVDLKYSQRLNQTAMNAATSVFAGLEGPVSNLGISIDSPLVRKGVEYMNEHANDAIKRLGYTPDMLASLVLAKMGAAQIQAATPGAMPTPASIKLAQAAP